MDKRLFVMLFIVIGLAGCSYVYTGNTECEPPAIAMSDINGNTVCVITPESQEQGVETKTEPTTPGAPETEITIDLDKEGEDVSSIFEIDKDAPKTEVPKEEPKTEVKPEVEEKPTVNTAGLPRKIVKAGELVSFPNLKATDPEGDEILYTFSAPLNTRGEWRTTEDDVGEHVVTIVASDGENEVSQSVVIVVEMPNRPPVIAPLTTIEVKEGDLVKAAPKTSDADADEVTLTFEDPLDEEGEWQTEVGDAGDYISSVIASDGMDETEGVIVIKVLALNRPPVLEKMSDIMVKEGEAVVLRPVVSDPDDDEVTVTYSGWMSSARYTTTSEDSGEYIVTVTASDGKDAVSQVVRITVEDVNRPPVFDPSAFS